MSDITEFYDHWHHPPTWTDIQRERYYQQLQKNTQARLKALHTKESPHTQTLCEQAILKGTKKEIARLETRLRLL